MRVDMNAIRAVATVINELLTNFLVHTSSSPTHEISLQETAQQNYSSTEHNRGTIEKCSNTIDAARKKQKAA